MLKSFILHLSRAVAGNRWAETARSQKAWQMPPREKFYISTDELKMVGMALQCYKKQLKSRKDFEKIQKLSELDERLFGFLDFLEHKPFTVAQAAEMA